MEGIFIDRETGEFTERPSSASLSQRGMHNNAETGEPEMDVEVAVQRRRVTFQIPRDVKTSSFVERKKRAKPSDELPAPVSGAPFAQTNPIFLLLIAVVYFRWILALLTILEVVFHIWTHRKNKRLADKSLYFRSPFHGLTSEFCALCQNENCMNRVGKMQEIRMHKFLRQCNYMKRAVT